MTSKWFARATAAVVIVLSIVAGYRWWASDERAIKNRLSAIADALTVTANEGDLGPVMRVGKLRKALAPDIRVWASPPTDAPGVAVQVPEQIIGRDEVLALAARWTPPPGGVTVEFVDVRVKVDDGRADALVFCTAKVTSRPPSEQPAVDTLELAVRFKNVEGAWLVASVRNTTK